MVITNPYYSARLQRKGSDWLVSDLVSVGKEGYEGPNGKLLSQSALSLISNAAGIATYITTDNYVVDSANKDSISGQTYSVVKVKLDTTVADEIRAFPYLQANLWFNQTLSRAFPDRVEVLTDQTGGTNGIDRAAPIVAFQAC